MKKIGDSQGAKIQIPKIFLIAAATCERVEKMIPKIPPSVEAAIRISKAIQMPADVSKMLEKFSEEPKPPLPALRRLT